MSQLLPLLTQSRIQPENGTSRTEQNFPLHMCECVCVCIGVDTWHSASVEVREQVSGVIFSLPAPDEFWGSGLAVRVFTC